jgi:phage terminase large subunit-like protein
MSASVQEWAEEIVAAYHHYEADRVIAETNDGGDLVKFTIHTVDNRVSFKGIHARQGKRVRAEPVAALYEQGRVHHVGAFPMLEDQMCTWVPGEADSPDRMDALVYAVSELMLGKSFSASSKPVDMPREGGKTEWEL